MSMNPLIIGVARGGNDVFEPGGLDDKSKKGPLTCFICGVQSKAAGNRRNNYQVLMHNGNKKHVCPVCASVMDIERFDLNNKKVKVIDDTVATVKGTEDDVPNWNAELLWLPEMSQLNINLLALAYHMTSWLHKRALSGDKQAEATAAREMLDVLDSKYMNVFRRRIEIFRKRECDRIGLLSGVHKESLHPPMPLNNIATLVKTLKIMPMSDYERRQVMLSGIRIMPKNLDHIDISFVESPLLWASLSSIYCGYFKTLSGLIPKPLPVPNAANYSTVGRAMRGQ